MGENLRSGSSWDTASETTRNLEALAKELTELRKSLEQLSGSKMDAKMLLLLRYISRRMAEISKSLSDA
jgi:hypothetical protein